MDIVFTFGLLIFNIIIGILCYTGLELLADKKMSGLVYFLGGHALLFLVTLFITYIPGKYGVEIVLFDEELGLVYKDGVLYQNIGLALLSQCAIYAILVIKDLWAALRKTKKLNGKLLLLCILYAVIVGVVGVNLAGSIFK